MTTLAVIQIRCMPEIDQDAHGSFTAVCPELGLAAMGETEEEAVINLKLTMQSYCNALRRKGLLDQALKESGIKWEEIPIEKVDPKEVVVDITP